VTPCCGSCSRTSRSPSSPCAGVGSRATRPSGTPPYAALRHRRLPAGAACDAPRHGAGRRAVLPARLSACGRTCTVVRGASNAEIVGQITQLSSDQCPRCIGSVNIETAHQGALPFASLSIRLVTPSQPAKQTALDGIREREHAHRFNPADKGST
jgi:hypothetical protein